MSTISIDQSLRLRSVYKKYNIVISCKEKMNWFVMKSIPVKKIDIDRLVYSIGVIADQRIILPTDTHWRKYRNYKCIGCNAFKLNFQIVDNENIEEEQLYILCNREEMKHHPNCSTSNKMLSKGRHVIEESEFLIDMLKTTNYGVEPKKEHDCKMLLKTI